MRRFTKAGLFLIGTLILLTASMPIAAQEEGPATNPEPETVILRISEALNQADIEAALSLVADDAVIVLFPPPPGSNGIFQGKDAIKGWWDTFTSHDGHLEFLTIEDKGSTVTWLATVDESDFSNLGLGPRLFSGTGIVQNGLLKSYTWSMTDQDLAELFAAIEKIEKREIVRQFYEEIWNKGDMAVVDAIISENFKDEFSGRDGSAAFKETVQGFREAFPDLEVTYEDLVIDGDVVVTRVAFTGTYQGGAFGEILGLPDSAIGTEATLRGIDYARIENGQYVHGWGLHNDQEWLLQLGVSFDGVQE